MSDVPASRPPIPMTPLRVAETYLGLTEIPGRLKSDPVIHAMLRQVADWPEGDHVPWCAAFIAACCRPLGLPTTRSLRARSWLRLGEDIRLADAEPGFDLVILTRRGASRDPTVIDAPGHVGWYAGRTMLPEGHSGRVRLLGGNQSDAVGYADYPLRDILGIRRL